MWVASNKIEEVVHWFYTHSKAEFLGLFVAGDIRFNEFLHSIIKNRATIDIISGSVIDLVMLTTETLEPDLLSGSAIRHISKLNKWTPSFSGKVTNATAMSTNEIATYFGLTIDELPGLVLLRRGRRSEKRDTRQLVLKLRGWDDVKFLIDFLRAFRFSLERFSIERVASIKHSERHLIRLEERVIQIAALRAAIKKREVTMQRCIKEIREVIGMTPQTDKETSEIVRSAETEADLLVAVAGLSNFSVDDIRSRVNSQTLIRIDRAKKAHGDAIKRLCKLEGEAPSIPLSIRHSEVIEKEVIALDQLLRSYERKIARDFIGNKILVFLNISDSLLAKVKRVTELALQMKTVF